MMRLFSIALLILILLLGQSLPAGQAHSNPININRISISTNGQEANGDSESPSISADGRFIAFASWASNLVPGDTNNTWDIFVRDRLTGETTRVSVASDGTEANGKSEHPNISADGRYVTFTSIASNLEPGITNYKTDIFVHDRVTHETTRVSVASDGTQSNGNSKDPSISADGRYVAFTSVATNLVPNIRNDNKNDVFVYDRVTHETTRVSLSSDGKEGNDHSGDASIRTNGRFIAFASLASNLVPGDIPDGKADIFVHDLQTHETKRISNAPNGSPGNGTSARPRISLNGEYIVFTSDASNLVPGDTNNSWDIFFHVVKTGKTTRVSVDSSGKQANGNSTRPRLSSDNGHYIVFASDASNLVPNDTNDTWDIFVHDRLTGETARVSANEKEGNNASDFPSISSDGKFIAFDSWASNLVEGDTNNHKDIFVVNNPLAEP